MGEVEEEVEVVVEGHGLLLPPRELLRLLTAPHSPGLVSECSMSRQRKNVFTFTFSKNNVLFF